MLDASGRYRIRYSDVLRAVGNHLDAQHMREITAVEVPEGFLLKGQVVQPGMRATQAVSNVVLFTNEDLEALIEHAYARRDQPGRADTPVPLSEAGELQRYEDVLRGIGHFFDQNHWHDVVIMQTGVGYHIKGMESTQIRDAAIDLPEVAALLHELRTSRRTKDDKKRRSWPF